MLIGMMTIFRRARRTLDKKDPYGNSWVVGDIARILEYEVPPDRELSDEEEEMLLEIHRETQYALQIFLSTGEMKVGTYVRRGGSLRDWIKVP
jgi:hypothetical protein